MYIFRGDVPNFGDELNGWLLPKVFPNFFDEKEEELFLGIGSVIWDHHSPESCKVVFGSGYGGYTAVPKMDESWRVYCVRGPRTADACGLGREKVAGDAAILIRRYRDKSNAKSFKTSFMPHWQSISRGNWEIVCAHAGVNFIDPRRPVEDVIEDIERSEVLVTEAMHGAIVADALRIPWIPILPFAALHRMKWYDWAEALDLAIVPRRTLPSSVREAWTAGTQRAGGTLDRLPKGFDAIIRALDLGFIKAASARLRAVAGRPASLSSDSALERATTRLEESAGHILRDYARR